MNCSEGTIISGDGRVYAMEDYYHEIQSGESYDGQCWTKYEDTEIIDDGRVVKSPVMQSHMPEEQMLFIKTKTGHSLLVQGNHPIWIYDEVGNSCVKEGFDVVPGDRLKIDRSILKNNDKVDAPFNPYYIGRFLADGCLRYGNGRATYDGIPVAAIVTGADLEIQLKTYEALMGKGVTYPKDIQVYSLKFAAFVQDIVRGRGARNKRLQPGFNLWRIEDLEKVLAGFIDGDSTCFIKDNSTVAKIYTSSYLILQQMEIICALLGIRFTPAVVSKRPLQKTPAFCAELRFKHAGVYNHSIKLQRIRFMPSPYVIKHEEFEPIIYVKRMWMWDKPVWDVKTETEGFTCGMIRNHNSFHTGGTATTKGQVGGFARIDQLLSLPKIVVGSAALAPISGTIKKITKGLAGGFDVMVGEKLVHVAKDLPLKVSVGQKVEAGDPLSEGVIKPQDLVKLKGMRVAQSYISNELQKAYADQGQRIHGKVFETIVRSLGNTTKVMNNSSDHSFIPGDVAPYNVVMNHNKNLNVVVPVDEATGQKLLDPQGTLKSGHILGEKDILYLKARGLKEVAISKDPIIHAPLLKGMSALPLLKRNWMANLGYRYLAKNLQLGAGQAWTSDLADYHPIPAFAYGETFGKGKEGRY
jgi:hypothetical protein